MAVLVSILCGALYPRVYFFSNIRSSIYEAQLLSRQINMAVWKNTLKPAYRCKSIATAIGGTGKFLWLRCRKRYWSGRRDSSSRHQPWEGVSKRFPPQHLALLITTVFAFRPLFIGYLKRSTRCGSVLRVARCCSKYTVNSCCSYENTPHQQEH
jgi:hypothetical protein